MSTLRANTLRTTDDSFSIEVADIASSIDANNFKADLANSADTAKGAALIGYNGSTVRAALVSAEGSIDTLEGLAVDTINKKTTVDGGAREVPDANHLINYNYRFAKRPKPPGLSSVPFDILGFMPTGRVAISKTPQQILDSIVTLPNATPSIGYVDNLGGSDANTGTIVQPWATLGFAVTQAAYFTKLSPGAHVPFATLQRSNTTGNRVRRFFGSGNPRAIVGSDLSGVTTLRATGDVLSAATWSVVSQTNQTTLVTANTPTAILNGRLKDEFGRPVPLTKQTSVANVAANGGWYYDAGTKVLSVRYGTTANFNTVVKPTLEAVYSDATTTGYVRIEGGEAYFENILFLGCFPSLEATSGVPAKVVFKNCAFWYSRVSAIVSQGSTVVLDNCEIYRCQGDGVNSHSFAGLEAVHYVINTDARYCGDFDTLGGSGDNNQNGMSMHENGLAVVAGCVITRSSGPNLIDTGSGPGSTGVSWWFGNHAEESLGNNPTNYDVYGVRRVWIESCSERGDGAVPVRSAESGTVLRYASNAVRGYTPTTSGLTVAYDPLDPI